MSKEELERPAQEPAAGEQSAAGEAAREPVPTADAGQDKTEPQARPSWEELLRDPEYRSRYDAAVQGIVKARLRGRDQAEARLSRLEPVLRVLEESYGLTDDGDAGALAELLRENAGLRRPSGEEIGAHLEALLREAEALHESVPDFDLLRELEDPDFLRLTAPHSGVSLSDAYYARHHLERERDTARRSLESVSRSLQSLGARPRELRENRAGARRSSAVSSRPGRRGESSASGNEQSPRGGSMERRIV